MNACTCRSIHGVAKSTGCEVRAQPDDLQPLDLAHLVEEHRHLRERYAEASEAGVRLDVHGQRAHRAAQALGEDLRHLEVAHQGVNRWWKIGSTWSVTNPPSTSTSGGRRRRRESPRLLDGGHANALTPSFSSTRTTSAMP